VPSLKQTRLLVLTSVFAILTAVGAFIKIPMWPVPLTMQTFFVILSGALLGPKFGMVSQLVYVATGLLGAPIFTNGGGIGYIFQPSFGFLLSYPIAAFVIGQLIWAQQKTSKIKSWLAISLGMFLIYFIGVWGLYVNLNYVVDKPISLSKSIWVGCIIFLPGTLLKMIAAIYLLPVLQKRLSLH